MEITKEIKELEIDLMDLKYQKKSKLLTIKIFDFTFVSRYNKSERVSKLLNDIQQSLKHTSLPRNSIKIMNKATNKKIDEEKTIKDLLRLQKALKIIKESFLKAIKDNEYKIELHMKKVLEALRQGNKGVAVPLLTEIKRIRSQNKKLYSLIHTELQRIGETGESMEGNIEEAVESMEGNIEEESKIIENTIEEEGKIMKTDESESEQLKREIEKLKKEILGQDESVERYDKSVEISNPPSKPSISIPSSAPPSLPPSLEPKKEELHKESLETTKPTEYNINMGMQYYSVMMEQKSYLFYIYFSHEEIKIEDEEGKVVYTTTVKIITTKKEPPKLYLRIQGDGFEVHPLDGNVVVSKTAVNPPVMIFSIMPLKSKKKKKKGEKYEGEKRTLDVLIDFEGHTISHTMLSIIIQPKHFHLDIGPLHINVGKKTAFTVSFLSVLIASVSFIYSIFTFEADSTAMDIFGRFAPGIASSLFLIVFIVSIVKGIYPLKEKWSGLLNFDKTTSIMK